jgi:hypothetical protein
MKLQMQSEPSREALNQMPTTETTTDLIELSDERRAGWHYQMLWSAKTNDVTITVVGKIEQNPGGHTQTATFHPPAERVAAVWERPFSHREYLTALVQNDD